MDKIRVQIGQFCLRCRENTILLLVSVSSWFALPARAAARGARSARPDRRAVGDARGALGPDALLELRKEGCRGGRGAAIATAQARDRHTGLA